MSIDTGLTTAIKEAMLSKNEVKLRTLRAIKTAFLNAKTAKGAAHELDEAQEIKIIQKLYSQRKDSFEVFSQQGRDDLAQKEKEEMDVLETYLPKQISDEELTAILKGIIEKVGAKSPSEMGKVMGIASKMLSGKADGSKIAATVKQLLSNL
ncbi:MAG: GatB/YqeY domain-containing protein [Chitinophagales bacterium]|nr:GatB/YqeY domain-containing protein [Chitinophagales bacterium]